MFTKAISDVKSWVQQEIRWTPECQHKLEIVGHYLEQTLLPPPDLYFGEQFNRSHILLVSAIRVAQDVTADVQALLPRLDAYVEFYLRNRTGEKTNVHAGLQMMNALDTLGHKLRALPADDQPPGLIFGKNYNRRLLLMIALCYTADLIAQQ